MKMYELQGPRSALVLEAVEGGTPLWRHWGPRLVGGAASLPPGCP